MIGLFPEPPLMVEGKGCFSSQRQESGQTAARANFRTKGYTIFGLFGAVLLHESKVAAFVEYGVRFH
jgi:hypothetical protein